MLKQKNVKALPSDGDEPAWQALAVWQATAQRGGRGE